MFRGLVSPRGDTQRRRVRHAAEQAQRGPGEGWREVGGGGGEVDDTSGGVSTSRMER